MSATIFEALLAVHAILAVVWLGAMIAAIFPALKLVRIRSVDPVRDPPTFKRGIVLSRIVAGAGGIAVLFGIILYYYINFVDKTFATSSSGLPLIGTGAALGVVALILSTYQSSKLRRVYKAKIVEASAASGTATSGPAQSSKDSLPSRSLIIVTPIILVIALVLMVVGSSI